MQETTCCFFGHREIQETEELKQQILSVVEGLIADKKVDTFLFGSKSRFNSLCHEQVTKIKERYPHIKRIYVGWRELNSLRLQKKIFGDSLPQNLKYGSIAAFCRLPLTQKFYILQVGEFLPPDFLCGEARICRKAGALQK